MAVTNHNHFDEFDEKLELISQLTSIYQNDYLGLPTSLLTHAVLNTMALKELIHYYLHEESGDLIVNRNILKRLPGYENKAAAYDVVFEKLKISGYLNRLRFRKLMDAVIESLDETRQEEYFTYFSNSNYRLEIRAAIKMIGLIWSEELGRRFLENYYRTENADLLEVLIANLEKEQFKQLAIKIWTAAMPNYLKPKLINRVKGWPLNDLEFVRKADPGNYIVLARYSGENLEDAVLLDCYNRIPESYRPFALWNLGRMGKWELIKRPIEEFVKNPTSTFPGFGGTIFE